jgi:hypothetical protein
MTAQAIVQSIGTIFKSSWKRHQKVLAGMVESVANARKLGVAVVGRHLPSHTTPKHAIKRVDRFLSSTYFDHREAQEDLLRTVIGPRRFVRIAVDWTKVRKWPALVAGVVARGRTIPVMWAVMDWNQVHKSQNAFENGFFTWLSRALPEGVEAVILLDRGFKRVELMKHLRRCGLHFVIRTGGNVRVEHPRYRGRLDRWITRRGQTAQLCDATLRPSRPVQTRLVGLWERGQKEPWILATDLPLAEREIARLYGLRFRIEETFRDQKDHRFGLALGYLRMTRADRLERMLLLAALVHFLAMLVGGAARRAGLDRTFRANTVRHKATHSDFTLGLYFLLRMHHKRSISFVYFYGDPCSR